MVVCCGIIKNSKNDNSQLALLLDINDRELKKTKTTMNTEALSAIAIFILNYLRINPGGK